MRPVSAVNFSVVAEDSDSSFTPCSVYLWLESRVEITNVSPVSYHKYGFGSAAAERVNSDSSSFLCIAHQNVPVEATFPLLTPQDMYQYQLELES